VSSLKPEDFKHRGFSSVADYLQGFDAAVNELVLLGVAIGFLVSFETRIKRRLALGALHRLRSLAHVVDMHQLTKDPQHLFGHVPDTPSSPTRALSPAELGRYLDYCSELVSLVSKIAALHVNRFNDSVTLSAVGDVEVLCGTLSQRIWQKLIILDVAQQAGQLRAARGGTPITP
jgi:hypothetical protein